MFALVDCNNFYVSCERVFRPDLNGRPVVVLSNNDGCIIARSDEAKALGIKMAQPSFEVKHLLKKHEVITFSSNYTLYGDMSQRVMHTLNTFAPNMEIYSIDEAFLDLDGLNITNLASYGEMIRYTVGRNTGMPVSVGIGPTKTLAKVANHIAKKENKGVFVLEKDFEALLKDIPVNKIWGIGAGHTAFLNKHLIFSAQDYVQMPDNWVRKHMSVIGLRTKKELQGISCIPMESVAPTKKAICTTRTFGKSIREYELVEEAIADHAVSCAYKLRREQLCANFIIVLIYTNRFSTKKYQYANNIVLRLPVPTNSSIEITRNARLGLKRIFKAGYHYKKAGVIVSGLVPASEIQQGLFYHVKRTKHQKAMQALDEINSRYGSAKVKLAAQGTENKWKARRDNMSPCYTTRWSDLITVKV